jgi:hypothetical protein
MSLKRGRALGRHANPCRRHFHRSIRSLSPPAEGCLAAEKDGLADSTAPLHPFRCLSQPLTWYVQRTGYPSTQQGGFSDTVQSVTG